MNFNKKYIIISTVVSMLFIIMFHEIYFLFEFLVPYSNIVNVVFAVILLFILKYFYDKKRLNTFIAISILSMIFFIFCLDDILPSFIEKVTNKTPEEKVEVYVRAVAENDKEKALSLWEIPDSYKLNLEYRNKIKDRGKQITGKMIEKGIKSDFTITHIEWWSTCCMPSVTENSRVAGEAKVHVQLIDSNNIKSVYIFDVIVPGGYEGGLTEHSIRHWVISDIYPENEESLFWTRKNENF
ncbi:MAG: hypothetical protein U9N04_02075 [Patescibacteria group bacterium]|nr:hypothetical protein [Patescibacteria group bacterium]